MRLPVDASGLKFIVATPPRPVQVFGGSGEVRMDKASGKPLYTIGVLASTDTDADVIAIKVPGPVEAEFGEIISLSGLTAEYWELDGRSGVSFRAEAIERNAQPAARKAATA